MNWPSTLPSTLLVIFAVLPTSGFSFNPVIYPGVAPSTGKAVSIGRFSECLLKAGVQRNPCAARKSLQNPSMSLERRSFLTLLPILTLTAASNFPFKAASATAPQVPYLQKISLAANDLEEEVDFFTKGLGMRIKQVRRCAQAKPTPTT